MPDVFTAYIALFVLAIIFALWWWVIRQSDPPHRVTGHVIDQDPHDTFTVNGEWGRPWSYEKYAAWKHEHPSTRRTP